MQLDRLDDRALVGRSQEGSREAFSLLVERYQEKVLNLVYQRLGDRDLALDVSQEVFLKAYRGLAGFQGNSKFFTWLFRITFNETISARRRQSRRVGAVSLNRETSDGQRLPDPADTRFEPAAEIERQDDQAMVQEGIRELEEDLAQVLLLRDIEGLSYQEIAQTLQVPLGSVKSRIHRARQALKGRLAKAVEQQK